MRFLLLLAFLAPQCPPAEYSVLHVLSDAEGADVRGHLVEHDGRLWGLAGQAGPSGVPGCNSTANWGTDVQRRQCPGSLFSLLPDGSDFRVEHAFSQLDGTYRNGDGYHPYGSLALGPDGRLWGVTQGGGHSPRCAATAGGAGVLFSYAPGDFRVEHEFCSAAGGADGRAPMGVVAFVGGSVYGTAKGNLAAGNSLVVWRWSPGGFAFAPSSTVHGWSAHGGLVAFDGALLGMTHAGATYGRGEFFRVDPVTLEVSSVRAFPAFTPCKWGTDNTAVQEPTVLSGGAVVAAREFGGANGTGVLVGTDGGVLLEMEGISADTAPRFVNGTGAMPNGRLVEGGDGLLYGTTMYGGEFGTGVVFSVARNGAHFRVLHSFGTTGPARPYGGLVEHDGALYGVTHAGRAVFRVVVE